MSIWFTVVIAIFPTRIMIQFKNIQRFLFRPTVVLQIFFKTFEIHHMIISRNPWKQDAPTSSVAMAPSASAASWRTITSLVGSCTQSNMRILYRIWTESDYYMQCFGSGSGLDSDGSESIRSVDPNPYSKSGSGSRRAKMTHKSKKNYEISCFEVLDVLFWERKASSVTWTSFMET